MLSRTLPIYLLGVPTALLVCACSLLKLPAASREQVERAASECKPPNWEWTNGVGYFDSEPEYPGEPTLSFTIEAANDDEVEGKEIWQRVGAIEACLRRSLSRKGVGANIAGFVSVTHDRSVVRSH